MTTQATEIKERPIIFCGDMVREILDGRKTQTRRVIKPQPDYSILKHGIDLEVHRCPILGSTHLPCEWGLYGQPYYPSAVPCFGYNCPYGKPGERLWVRETWRLGGHYHDFTAKDVREAAEFGSHELCDHLHYKAEEPEPYHQWRSSIHMPRWASRITLEVTDVRMGRVQGITTSDIIDEGTPGHATDAWLWGDRYRDLWNSINAKRGYSWESNPLVWAITFKRIKHGH